MKELKDCFGLSKQEIVSVIGSGGKSSLIAYLANSYSHEKVLISTTTKVLMAREDECDELWLDPVCWEREIMSGIVIAGDKIIQDGILKLQMPKDSKFVKIFNQFDKVFLESDGSRGLPLKGWMEYEPVILPETSMTIGIVPITAIGKPVTKEFIHRLPLWLELIEGNVEKDIGFDRERDRGKCTSIDKEKDRNKGEKRGKTIILEKDLAKTIANEKGLWSKAKGKRVLLINQVEDKEQLESAKRIVELLPDDCKKSLNRIIVGSVMKEVGEVIH